jgi:hypothetical protein
VKEKRLSRKPSGLETPEKIQNLQWRLYQKAKQENLRKLLEEDDWKAP